MVRALPRPPPWVCMARARFGSHEGIAVMRTKADRLEKLVAMMAAILAAGCIAHGQVARLRGHLQFLSSTLLFGGRLAQGAISAASRAPAGRGGPSPSLRAG